MHLIIAYCESSNEELSNLKSSAYSKNTFNTNFPFLKQVSSDAPKQDRHWKQKYVINGNHYVVTSEWYKVSIPFFKAYLDKITSPK